MCVPSINYRNATPIPALSQYTVVGWQHGAPDNASQYVVVSVGGTGHESNREPLDMDRIRAEREVESWFDAPVCWV